jgi:RNA polymerase sigma factor (sigma-70 family)
LIKVAQNESNLIDANQAKEELLLMNQRLIYKIANRYTSANVDIDDLIQSGNLGFLRAIETYDSTRGSKLSTHAYKIVTQYIVEELINTRMIHVSPYVYKRYKKNDRLYDLPRIYLGLDSSRDGSGKTKLDYVIDENNPETLYFIRSKKSAIRNALSILASREQKIIEYHYGFKCDKEYTLEEIAQCFKLSKSRIHKIIRKSLNKLRIYLLQNEHIQYI